MPNFKDRVNAYMRKNPGLSAADAAKAIAQQDYDAGYREDNPAGLPETNTVKIPQSQFIPKTKKTPTTYSDPAGLDTIAAPLVGLQFQGDYQTRMREQGISQEEALRQSLAAGVNPNPIPESGRRPAGQGRLDLEVGRAEIQPQLDLEAGTPEIIPQKKKEAVSKGDKNAFAKLVKFKLKANPRMGLAEAAIEVAKDKHSEEDNTTNWVPLAQDFVSGQLEVDKELDVPLENTLSDEQQFQRFVDFEIRRNGYTPQEAVMEVGRNLFGDTQDEKWVNITKKFLRSK